MLCTFTTEHGNIVIRSDDIRSIEDMPPADDLVGTWSLLRWAAGIENMKVMVKDTVIANRDRIQQEELDLIDRVNQHHLQAQQQAAMMQQMIANPPKVQRGRQS